MKLAIETDIPAFKEPLHVGFPHTEAGIQEGFFHLMEKVFARAYLTNDGPFLRDLEEKIGHIHGVKHCVAVCNGTIGQMILLEALGIEGEVILPAFTFISTAHAVHWQKLRPVFCDISKDTLTIDVASAERSITSKTSAILGVHLFGNVCDVEGLTQLKQTYGIKLIFDAAHAFRCSLGDNYIGGFGEAEFFSFHATKFFSTFEGGAILTNDSCLAEKLKLLRNFGFQNIDLVGSLGINAKMSEPSAAMGLASLQVIEDRKKRLKKNYQLYREILSNIPGIHTVPIGQNGKSNYHYVVILIDKEDYGVSRDILYEVLWRENIFARRYFYPGCHRMEPYNTLWPNASERLPVTEDVIQRILCLPSNIAEPEADIATICDIIRCVYERADEVLKWEKKLLRMR